MPLTLVLEDFPSPALARTLSPNGRASYWARIKPRAAVRTIVQLAVMRAGRPRIAGPVAISAVFVRPTRGRVDLDNLSTGVWKAAQDALVRFGVIADDHSGVVRRLDVQTRYERGRRALEITLAPITEGGDAPSVSAALNGISGDHAAGCMGS